MIKKRLVLIIPLFLLLAIFIVGCNNKNKTKKEFNNNIILDSKNISLDREIVLLENKPSKRIFSLTNLEFLDGNLFLVSKNEVAKTVSPDDGSLVLATILFDLKELLQPENIIVINANSETKDYYKEFRLILKDDYTLFLNEFNKARKILKDGGNYLETSKHLLKEVIKFKNKIINGTKPIKDTKFNNLLRYNKSKNDLKLNIDKLTNLLYKAIVINGEIKEENYFINSNLINKSNYLKLINLLRKSKHLHLYNDYDSNNLNINYKYSSEFETINKELKNILNNINNYIIKGTKPTNTKEYKVNIYENNKLVETKSLNSNLDDNVYYTPDIKKDMYISSKSKLNGYLSKDNDLTLEVYYENFDLIIPIDLDGGKNKLEFPYFKVKQNHIIDDNIKNKLIDITKENDEYSKNYEFSHFIDSNGNIIDINKPIEKYMILKACYNKESYNINYDIHIYRELPFGTPFKTNYPRNPEILKSIDKQQTGESLYYDPKDLINEGYLIDYEKSSIIIPKFSKNDYVTIYLKRKRLSVDIDLGLGKFEDERFNNGKGVIKYGQIFDFPLSSIKHNPRVNNKHTIFDYAYDLDNNQKYELGKEVKENLNLKIYYKDVSNISIIKVFYSYLGAKMPTENGIDPKDLFRISYIEKGSKINDPSLFIPDTECSIASFNLDKDIGFILKDYNKFDINSNINEDNVTLKLVYNTNISKQKDILFGIHFRNYLLNSVDREIKGTILGNFDNIYLLEDENKDRFIAICDNGISNNYKELLEVGNEVILSGPLVLNYDNFSKDIETTFKSGRFCEFSLILNASTSTVKLISKNNQVPGSITVDDVSKLNELSIINLNNLLVDKVGKSARNLDIYEDKLTIVKPYIEYRLIDSNGNYLYLLMNDKATSYDKLLNLKKGDIINLKNAYYVKSRIDLKGFKSFNNSCNNERVTIFIDNYDTQVEKLTSNKEKVKLNYIFNKPNINFTSFSNFNKEILINNNAKYSYIYNLINNNEIYNGYYLKDIVVDDNIVKLDENIDNTKEVNLIFEAKDEYILYYLGTLTNPDITKDNLEINVSIGGKTYNTKPIDSDGNFYKFVITYDKLDKYIRIQPNFNINKDITDGVNDNFTLFIELDNSKEKVKKYVSYDAFKYNYVHNQFGNNKKNYYEFTWGNFTADKLNDNAYGFYMHAFTTEKTADSMFADCSLYSKILTEHKGFIGKDGEVNINKDHNMQPNLYSRYDGARFFQIDSSKYSLEDIKNSDDLILRSFQVFPRKDINENGIEYETNETEKFYFYKDSLTKFVKFNKFGLGIIYVDLNPNLKVGNKEFIRPNKETHEIPYKYQDSKLTLEKTNDRVFTTKEEFFNYLEKTNTKANKTNYIFQHLDDKTINIKYNILNDDTNITFSNGKKELEINTKYNALIDKSLLEIKNTNNMDILFIDSKTSNIIENPYRNRFIENKQIDILLLTKTIIEIQYSSNFIKTDNVTIENRFANNLSVFSEFSGTNINPNYTKSFKLEAYRTNIVENKYNNLENIIIVNINGNIKTIKLKYSKYHGINRFLLTKDSNELIPLKDDTVGILFIKDDNNSGRKMNDYYFKTTYKDNATLDSKDIYKINKDTYALILSKNSKEYREIKEISLYKDQSKLFDKYKFGYKEAYEKNIISLFYLLASKDDVKATEGII